MNVIKVAAEPRADFGKQASANYRKQGKVLCVMYGGEEVKHFVVDAPDVKPFVFSPDFHVVEVELDGQNYRTVVKDIQFHPVNETVEHIDFQELVKGKKVKVSVPVRLVGDALGVKDGGSLVPVMRKVKIKSTPEHLISELEGDVSHLDLNQSIYIREVNVPEGVEILQDMGAPIGYVAVPRSLKSLESSAVTEEGELEEGEEEEVEGETEETTAPEE